MLAAGVLDTTFGSGGVAVTPIGSGEADIFDMAVEPDGKLVAVGLALGQGYAVARYNADGSLDTTFGNSGTEIIPSTGSAHRVAIQSDGKIVLSGDTNGAPDQTVVVRLTDSGALDSTFGAGGKVTVGIGGGSALAIDSSGRIIVAGGGNGIARLNSDGTLDTTFGTHGIAAVTITSGNASGFDITRAELQPDGKIVLSGNGPHDVSNTITSDIALARLNANGTLDTSFGGGGTVTTSLQETDIAYGEGIQSDGKIVVGGFSRGPAPATGYELAMVRYNSDGTLDSTFGTAGSVVDTLGKNSMIFDMLVEPNGKIVASGQANGGAAVVRFNSDGSLDSTFGSGGVALAQGQPDGQAQALVEQANGKYVIGALVGGATFGTPNVFTVERFTGETPPTTSGIADVTVPAGSTSQTISLSSDFTGGSVPDNQLSYSLVGDTNPALFSATTINSGTLTLAFAPNQTGNSLLTVRAGDPDGDFVDASFQVTVVSASTDNGFGTAGISSAMFPGGSAEPHAMALQSDGRVIEAGWLSSASPRSLALARFKPDGSLDASFGNTGEVVTPVSLPSYGLENGLAMSVLVQADGKIVVAGSLNATNLLLTRFNADGTLDTSFGAGGFVISPGVGYAQVLEQPDGKLVAAGYSASGFVVARYNNDGTPDTTFNIGGATTIPIGSGSSPYPEGSIAEGATLQSDGKIVVVGLAGDANKKVDIALVRVDADGTPDATFGIGGTVMTSLRAGQDVAGSVVVLPNGKIVVGGSSQRSANTYIGDAMLARYNADGSLDTTFGTGGAVILPAVAGGSGIQKISVQADGKIVASGSVGPYPTVLRFNPDGSLDTSFDGTGMASVSVGNGLEYGTGLAIQPDGNYLQAAVATLNGQTEFAAVRYLNGSAAVAPVQLTAASGESYTEGAAASSQTLATFTDANGDLDLSKYQAAIDWGDGSSAAAALSGPDANGVFTVLGSHAYAEESTGEPLTVTVARAGAAPATLHASVPVADAPLSGAGLTLSTTAGSALSGPLASFSDGNLGASASDFSAAIDWGDGTKSTGTVGADPGAVGAFIVTGSHVYSDAAPATAPITVVVNDVGGSSTTITSQGIVSQPAIIGSGATLGGTQAAALSGVTVATFTRGDGSESAADFSANIDWGDGQTSTGTITQSAGTYSVVGTHTYATSGAFVIGTTVSVHGSSTLITGNATIVPAPTAHQLYVESVYHDVLGRSPDASGLSYWTSRLDTGAPVSSVAASIAHSDEYYANFVIKPDYLKYLGRAADDSGVSYWTTKMQAGLTDGQLAAQLVASDEFFKQAGGSNSAWIDAAYQALLGRAADAGGDAYWIGKLSAGETRLQVAQGFTGSVESDKSQINDDYLHYLGRPADAAGMDHWLSQFTAGSTNEDLIAAFTGSDEYYKSHST